VEAPLEYVRPSDIRDSGTIVQVVVPRVVVGRAERGAVRSPPGNWSLAKRVAGIGHRDDQRVHVRKSVRTVPPLHTAPPLDAVNATRLNQELRRGWHVPIHLDVALQRKVEFVGRLGRGGGGNAVRTDTEVLLVVRETDLVLL